MMTGIINYGMGNLLSVYNAYDFLGVDVKICSSPDELKSFDKIVLPGVGAFGDCMTNLKKRGFTDVLEKLVIQKGIPILGICVGMQVMARQSFEDGIFKGLGWFNADVVKIEPENSNMKIPHIGWNNIKYNEESPLFEGIPCDVDFYFVHSFHLKPFDEIYVDAVCDYGGLISAAVRKKNIFATQFHPEKSQDYGLRILENFLKWKP